MTTDTNLDQTLTRRLTGPQATALHEHFFHTLDSDAFPMAPDLFAAFLAATGYPVAASLAEDAVKGALEAALWTGSRYNAEAEETESEDLRRPFSEVPQQIQDSLREDVQGFIRDHASLIEQAVPLYAPRLQGADWTVGEQIGHDFTLTRNHEGAGFWDRGLGSVGDLLTQGCHPYGSFGIEADENDDLHQTS